MPVINVNGQALPHPPEQVQATQPRVSAPMGTFVDNNQATSLFFSFLLLREAYFTDTILRNNQILNDLMPKTTPRPIYEAASEVACALAASASSSLAPSLAIAASSKI